MFNSVYAGPEAIADELNPLTTNHTARTISCTAIGRAKKIKELPNKSERTQLLMPMDAEN
jgi:hypothetical protein